MQTPVDPTLPEQEAAAEVAGSVRRRHVLYLAGFDPQGPGQYHARYRREAALQAPVGGYEIDVGPKQRVGAHATAWEIRWQEHGASEVETRYELLRWDDIVRKHWPTGQWTAVQLTWQNTWHLLRNGCYWRFLHISWPAVLALLMPGLLLLGVGAAALALLLLAGWGLGEGMGLLGLGLTAAAGYGLFRFARWAQDKMYMGWLMRSTRVILSQARGELPELEGRLDHFADRVVELASDAQIDELLVVGHSSGAMLAASVVARALQRHPSLASGSAAGRPRLGLLTLGHCMPLLSCQPEAAEFRRELAALRHRGNVPWVDFTAPADGCCSALTDPTALHALENEAAALTAAGASPAIGPKLLSPRFNKLFSATAYAAVRRDKYRCHFQYLMATELRGDYDYFAITAGPLALGKRFERHASITDFRDFQLFGGPGR